MSWQLASFALVGLVLLVGFTWYERQHPSAKTLALVATLAALAAIGRIAFAPIPSVKPTTDIVLIAGFSLGAAPGFVVGAVAALASNVFFGQGPFTPWQMAAWGMVGLFGAGMARVLRGKVRRIPLAAACGFAGLAFGAFLDFHLWVLYAGEHSWAEYWVLAGKGVPFNVTHAVANIVFFLAFGPLLIKALARYRERLEVTWKPLPAGLATAALGLVVAVGVLLATAGATAPRADAAPSKADRTAAAKAAAYLRSTQNADGGFGASLTAKSDQLNTSWAVMGLRAAGRDARKGGKSGADYMAGAIGSIRSTGDTERTILGLVAGRRSPRSVRGRNLVNELIRKRRSNGSFSGLVNQTAFGILALRAAGRSKNDGTIRAAGRWLARQQNGDGGFNFQTKGGESGIDDTAGALMGLVASGQGSRAGRRKAADFLARQQKPDGGLPLTPGQSSNAQSTAWAIQGLVSVGRDPDKLRRGGARSPLAYLRSLQTGSGVVRYSRTSAQTPVWVTAQALTAFARKPFPIR